MKEILYGKLPVLEALRAKRRAIKGVYLQRGMKDQEAVAVAVSLAGELGVSVSEQDGHWFKQNFPNVLSQGWAAEVGAYPQGNFKEWLQRCEGTEQSIVLALDQVQDPQNLGAMLRTAEACGVQAVLLPEKHSCPLTAAVSKASAGALEHLNILRIKNLTQSLKLLKDKGFWVVGTEMAAGSAVYEFEWSQKVVLVMGSEGAGMRRLTTETCDFLIHLPLVGNISSLNVSATAAVCLYYCFQAHRAK